MPVLFFIMFVCVPARTFAAVRISEIAWMGIAGLNGQYGEWIELYNDGTDTVDLSGWKLYGDGGGQLIYTFSKSIAPGGYYVAERTTASVPDPVPGIDDEHGTFGGGGFSNAGEDLVLKDAAGNAVQSLNFTAGWPAGDATTKETMQWDGTSWVTAEATPKAKTAGSVSETPKGDGSTDEAPAEPDTPKDALKVTVQSKAKAAPVRPKPHIELVMPRTIATHVPYKFYPTVYTETDTNPIHGVYRWNFGDGASLEKKEPLPVSHTYRYPGAYTIWFGYYQSVFDEDPSLFVQTEVSVQKPDITASVLDAAAIRLTNNSKTAVDLSKWTVQSGRQSLVLPPMTMLAPNGTIVIDMDTLNMTIFDSVQLVAPDGTPVESGEVLGTAAAAGDSVVAAEVSTIEELPLAEANAPASEPAPSAQQEIKSEQKATKAISARAWVLGAASLTVLALFILLVCLTAKRE